MFVAILTSILCGGVGGGVVEPQDPLSSVQYVCQQQTAIKAKGVCQVDRHSVMATGVLLDITCSTQSISYHVGAEFCKYPYLYADLYFDMISGIHTSPAIDTNLLKGK